MILRLLNTNRLTQGVEKIKIRRQMILLDNLCVPIYAHWKISTVQSANILI